MRSHLVGASLPWLPATAGIRPFSLDHNCDPLRVGGVIRFPRELGRSFKVSAGAKVVAVSRRRPRGLNHARVRRSKFHGTPSTIFDLTKDALRISSVQMRSK